MSLLGNVDVAFVDKGKEMWVPGEKLEGDIYIKLPKPVGADFAIHAQLRGTAVYEGCAGELARLKAGKKKKNKDAPPVEDRREQVYAAGHTYKARSGDTTATTFHFFFTIDIPPSWPASGSFQLKSHPEVKAHIEYSMFVWLDTSGAGVNNPPVGDKMRCSRAVPIFLACRAQVEPETVERARVSGVIKPAIHVDYYLPHVVHAMPSYVDLHYDIDNKGKKEVETCRFAIYEVSTINWLGEKPVTMRTQVLADHPKQPSWVPKLTKRSFKEKTEVTEPYGVEVGGLHNAYHEGEWSTHHEVELRVYVKKVKKPLVLVLPIKAFKKHQGVIQKIWELRVK